MSVGNYSKFFTPIDNNNRLDLTSTTTIVMAIIIAVVMITSITIVMIRPSHFKIPGGPKVARAH